MAEEIELADFIANFKTALNDAMRAGATDRLQFAVSKVDLELQFTVEKVKGGGGKLDFKILGTGFGLEGEGKATNKVVHSVKLSLDPLLDGKPYDPRISGPQQSRQLG